MTKMNGMVEITGYIPARGIELQEYLDFIGQRISLLLVKNDLDAGNYPPGLILRDHTGIYQVFGKQGEKQTIWPIRHQVEIARE